MLNVQNFNIRLAHFEVHAIRLRPYARHPHSSLTVCSRLGIYDPLIYFNYFIYHFILNNLCTNFDWHMVLSFLPFWFLCSKPLHTSVLRGFWTCGRACFSGRGGSFNYKASLPEHFPIHFSLSWYLFEQISWTSLYGTGVAYPSDLHIHLNLKTLWVQNTNTLVSQKRHALHLAVPWRAGQKWLPVDSLPVTL